MPASDFSFCRFRSFRFFHLSDGRGWWLVVDAGSGCWWKMVEDGGRWWRVVVEGDGKCGKVVCR